MTYNKALLTKIHKQLIKAQGGGTINGVPTVRSIMQMPESQPQGYRPSPAVMNTKAGLAAAGMVSGPLSFIPGTAAAVYDLGTAARYAMDGQWGNAKEDLISAGLSAIPTAGVYSLLAGMGKLQKAARARAAIRTAKTAMNAKDLAGSSTIRNRITGRVQEFDKAGNEVSSMRPRSVGEVNAFNQNLKRSYRTEATPEVPEHMRPYENFYARGGMITDPLGQWAHPGKNTRIPGSSITMQGVPYPVLARANNGMTVLMQPGQNYNFNGADYVDEYPMMELGGGLLSKSVSCSNCGWSWKAVEGGINPLSCHKCGGTVKMKNGGQHGGLDRWFAEKWVDVKTGKACGRQEGEKRAGYPACRPSKRVSSETPKTASELSSSEREKFKRSKTSSERINYQHRRKEDGGEINETDMANKPNNPALWSRAKSMAKQKFDVYPSAYANGWAAKWYKGKGGTWRKAEYGMEVMENGGTNNPGFQALPEYVQAKILSNMGYGGYTNPMTMMDEGGEANGEMAMGQMASVADKMSNLLKFIKPDQNLDPWIASKLAVMDHSANAINDYMMYGPESQEEEGEEEMAKGGYVVTRSNDRKGKTHKVTGPDGTVKYFGDSKLGQHPKDPERKAAFYARHKKNLANNPFFRAFARKTWANGGEIDMMGQGGSTFSGNAWYEDGGDYKSVADYAKASGRGNSFADRKAIAEEVGIANYKGTAAQNKALLDRLVLSDSKNVMRPGQSELINPETGETEYLDNTYTESDSLRDLRLEGIRSSYDALQKRNTVLPQPKTATKERVKGTTVPSRYVAAPGPFDYLNNPIMNYLKAPVRGSRPAPVVYEDEQPTTSRFKIPAYDPYPFRNAGNNTKRQQMTDIESTPDIDFNALQQVYRSANPGAIDANELSRRGRTSLNREGNTMYDADSDMTGAQVMQRKMAAGAYGSEAAQNALRTNPNNPLGAFTQYMTGLPAEQLLGVGTGALKIATGRGEMGDAAMVGLAMLPGGVKLASKAPAFARLMQMRTIGPMSRTMGNPMMEGVTLENIFSGANKFSPSVRKVASQYKYDMNKLAEAAKRNKEIAKLLDDAAQEEEILMSGVGATRKAFNAGRASKNMNDLYERSGFKYGGIHINPANKGKFTASANAAGMGVQEFASHVLANKEDYSSTQVKRANFAHNAAGWNKAEGGEIMDVTPEELEILRQQGYQFEIL